MRQNNQQKTNSFRGCVTIIFILVLIVLGILFYAQNWYNNAVFEPASEDSATVPFEVTEGDTLLSVADSLEQKGLIKSKLALQLYVRQYNLSPNIKVGKYEIKRNETLPSIISILEKGVFEPGIRVTIKEGLRYEQIADILSAELSQTQYDNQEFVQIMNNPEIYSFNDKVQTFLNSYKPSGKSLRGFLYPDSYEFANDTTTLQVVEKMIENFIVRVEKNINLESLNLNQNNITNLYDALILASVIEKEASAKDDRKDISSVFHNRLSIGMALQSDATVNFVTGKNDAGVLIADTQVDNPYNTYKYAGLMPTPINNPRIESIIAALYPNNTEYYYFLHDPQGNGYFSITLEEHSRKVQQYLGSR